MAPEEEHADSNSDVSDKRLEAASLVRELLDALAISTVIHVDDEYIDSHSIGLTEVRAALASRKDVRDQVFMILDTAGQKVGHVDTENSTQLGDFTAEVWTSLEDETRGAIIQAARSGEQSASENLPTETARSEVSSGASLIELIRPHAILHQKTSRQWRAEAGNLLGDDQKVLVLFDLSFVSEGGSETEGENLLAQLLREDRLGVKCGLLTHNATSIEDELSQTADLETRLGLEPGSVAVVGKFRLEDTISTFPEALRALVLAREVEAYRKLALRGVTTSARAARDALNGLERYTLVAAIAAATKEGSFEPDSALRIAQSAFRRTMQQQLRTASFAKATLPRLRNVSAINLFRRAGAVNHQVGEVLWQDQFEDPDVLNALALPIEVGDIFELDPIKYKPLKKNQSAPKPSKYILLTQACDLSVRSGGTRMATEFVLHKVKQVEPKKEGEPETPGLQRIGSMTGKANETWAVDFRYSMTVPDLALDLTVGTFDGRAVYSTGDRLPKIGMAPGWGRRFESIRTEIEAMIDRQTSYEALVPLATLASEAAKRQELLDRAGAASARATIDYRMGVTAKIDIAARKLTYGVQRVGRVVSQTAASLTSLSASHEGRAWLDAPVVLASEVTQ